jgi:uncharacterized protein YjiK
VTASRRWGVWCLGVGVALPAPLGAQWSDTALARYTGPASAEWRLPGRLREISGLAITPDDRLFAHDDEEAILYQIDYRSGTLLKAFAMGGPTVKGDFEGVAYVDERFYLVSSAGNIYESREGRDGERMRYNRYETGVGDYCEVEGLAFEPSDRTLLMLCKEAHVKQYRDFLTIFRWSMDERELARDSVLRIPLSDFPKDIADHGLRPSGIERHPVTGTYIIVAARETLLAEVTKDGKVLRIVHLPPNVHRQAEGITFASDDTMFISDEGGSSRARLVLYPAR